MTTPWTSPTTFIQYAEPGAEAEHISWFDQNGFSDLRNPNGRFISTSQPLMHIARQPRNDITMKTWYLQCTGYNFSNLPEVISGITVKLSMNRGGRIADETIQLTYQGNSLGDNLASSAFSMATQTSSLEPVTFYNGSIDGINLPILQDPSFGVTLRFQSHPYWPHKTSPGIDCVELQIS